MDEKIFFSDKEPKTIAELKAIGGINLPVFKDGKKMYKTSLDELLSASLNTVILPYETATYAIINEIAQSGKQVIIYYIGVDDAQFWTLSHKTAELSYVFTWVNGNSLVTMIMSSGDVWSEEVIDIKAIKDNAFDSGDNITEVQELTFFRNQGTGANYPILSSEERTYGVLLPAPALQADQGKVPMYKVGDKIGWEHVPTQDSVTAIQAVIPATASSTNQLADKAYVDFGMEQNTAKYLSADALGNPFTGSVPDADDTYFYAGATTLPTKNDYLIVNGDTAHDGAVTRYYFAQDGEVGQWQFQYVVNNSPLNVSQLDAINSGWTATKTSEHDSDHTTLSTHVGDTTGNPHGVTKVQVGLGNVENYKAVSVVASQGLTDAEKVAARGNIDAAKDLVSLTITPVIVGTTATLTIEQGGFVSIDLTSETALTAVAVVLTNTAGVVMPVWWFKIKAGSDITLSVEINSTAVGWLGSAITNIALSKTVEVSVVDGIACGGVLL